MVVHCYRLWLMVDSWATTLLLSNKFWEASATWRLQRLAGHPFCFNHERGPFIITISICKSSQSQVCSMLYPIRSPRTFLHIFSLFVPGMWTAEGTVRHMLLQKETPILPPDPARHLTLVVTSPRTPCDEGLRHWKRVWNSFRIFFLSRFGIFFWISWLVPFA